MRHNAGENKLIDQNQEHFCRRVDGELTTTTKANIMKFTKHILSAVLLTGLAGGVLSARADDKHSQGEKKAKPYPLAKCIVSDEKF